MIDGLRVGALINVGTSARWGLALARYGSIGLDAETPRLATR